LKKYKAVNIIAIVYGIDGDSADNEDNSHEKHSVIAECFLFY